MAIVKRLRRVFGRLVVDTGGRPVRLELTRDGLVATPRNSRQFWRMPLKTLVVLVMAQAPRTDKKSSQQRVDCLPLLRRTTKGKEENGNV